MNHKQVELVQASWKKVLEVAEPAALLFYARLFALDPSIVPVSSGGLEQGRKLFAMLTVAVNGLARIETLAPVIDILGRNRRHRHVTEALLWTLDYCLGKDFTAETKQAWIEAYARVEAKAA